MQIDSIEIFHVGLPLRRPLAGELGSFDKLETVLVRLDSGSTVGWGEASPGAAPLGGPDWAAGVFGCVRDWLAPRLAGRMVDSGDSLQERLGPVRGNRYAKAALDTAWWDLSSRLQNKPLHEALGGKRKTVEIGVGFDQMESMEEFLKAIGGAYEAGFARVELKFRPGWDVNMLNVVRQEFGAQQMSVDVEGGMGLQHMETLCRLDDFMLAMIEQPLPADDLVGSAMVQDTIRTPLSLDESITTPQQADMALELKSCGFVNIRPDRVGGLTPAVAIHDACHRDCTPCWVGGGPQTAVGARIRMALAAKENCSYPADWFPPEELFQQDLADLPQTARDETDNMLRAILWTEPGIGVEPDMALLEKYCLQRVKL